MGMRLSQVRVRNFGPYYGEQELAFGGERPIVLVHGENMRGKTSLLNSVRWALYGHALDRFGRFMPLDSLVNRDAATQGDRTMSVELGFVVDGSSYDLTRQVQPKDPSVPPRDDRDFEHNLFLRRDGNYLSPEEAQITVNRLLPESISRFFLFDGELLNEYETLLADLDQQAQVVKESIESILGVPALQNAIADLKQNLKDASRRQRGLAKQDQSAQVFAAHATRLENDIEAAERDLGQLGEQRDEMTRQKRQLDEVLSATAGLEAEMERLRSLDNQVGFLRGQEERLLEDKRQNLALAWRDVLQPAIRRRMERLEGERDGQLVVLRQVGELEAKLRDLERLGEAERCPTCHQPVAQAHPEDLEEEKREAREALARYEFDEGRVTELSQSIGKLRKVVGSGAAATVKHIEEQLIDIRIQLADHELRRDEIADRLKGHDEAAVARNRRDYEGLTKELGVLEHAIREREKAIEGWQREASKYRSAISQVSGPQMGRLNREVQVYEELVELFQRGVVRLRDELRTSVERDASEIFLRLTTDKTYGGLRINAYYGLTIVDANGDDVQVRSAGAEQVVALSLIGALNRNAVRRGPIIMDTPFGRLDPTHRENILRFLPTLADQVTLLVHSGEVDRGRDLEHVKDRIDREYKIGYVSSRRSELVPIKE